MAGFTSPRLGRLRLPRWIGTGLCVGLPALAIGCSAGNFALQGEKPSAALLQGQEPAATVPPAPSAASAPSATSGAPAVQQVQHVAAEACPTAELPITLDAVFRLAEKNNPRIGLAREQLNESLLTQTQRSWAWLPNTFAGLGYFRHEGGIQDQNGQLIHSSTGAVSPGLNIQSELDLRESAYRGIDAQRRVWQEKASLSRVNNEILLDAAVTYIDLLTARRGEAVLRDLATYEQKLLDRAKRSAKAELAAGAVVAGLEATLANRELLLSQMRQQGDAASAKLVYLLGLPPQTVLLPVDPVLAPIDLVDVTAGPDKLIAQALSEGPGIRELQGMLGVIQLGLDMQNSINNLLPSLRVNAYEGAFGAGPGGSMNWDNRLDLALQVRWNLTQLFQSDLQRTITRSKQSQALWNYAEVRGKLAASVIESVKAIEAARLQIGLSTNQLGHASENYRLTDRLLGEGAPAGDVILGIRAMEQAHFNRLSAISAHNKAQIRLLLLMGVPCSGPRPQSNPLPPPAGKPAPADPAILPPPTALPAPIFGGPDGSLNEMYPR